jgi:hypothetical protein
LRRRLCLLLASLAAVAVSAPAHAAPPKDLTFDVEVGGTTCEIVATLFTPDGVSKANPAPAILATNGFGGSRDEFDTLAPSYAKRGYVFLAYSGLGFGGSGCRITLDNPATDGVAGRQLVDFLAGEKAAKDGTKIDFVATEAPRDPLVGMIGGSYGGQIQFAIASQDPRLDALVPQITWSDLSYSLTPNNTDFERGVTYRTPGVVKLDWPVLFTALGFANPVTNADADATHLGPCPNFDDRVCTSLATSGTLGYPTAETLELLRGASVATYVDKIRIPTFLSQGQSDTLFNVQEAVATYDALRRQGTPVKMLWRSAGHSGGGLGAQENSAGTPEIAYESRQALEWFDFWLRGIGEPPGARLPVPARLGAAEDRRRRAGGRRDADLPGGTGPAALPLLRREARAVGGRREGRLGRLRRGRRIGEPAAATPRCRRRPPSPTRRHDRDVRDRARSPRTSRSSASRASRSTCAPRPTPRRRATPPASSCSSPSSSTTTRRPVEHAAAQPVVRRPRRRRRQAGEHRAARRRPPLPQGPRAAPRHRHEQRDEPRQQRQRPRLDRARRQGAERADHPPPRAQAGATGAGQSGTTRFTPAPGAPAPQTARRPSFGARNEAARMPGRCRSRRRFVIHLRKPPKGDRIRSATVTINGKRQKVLRGRRVRAIVNLRGLPKGTFRVAISVRTAKGRTLRSARTYRTCAGVKRP